MAQRSRKASIFAALSLGLFLATGGLWLRSNSTADLIVAGDGSRYWFSFILKEGTVALAWRFNDGYDHPDYLPFAPQPRVALPSHWAVRHRQYPVAAQLGNLYTNLHRRWLFAGVGRSNHGGREYLLIPIWVLMLPWLIAPAWLVLSRLRKRTAAGKCAACGYDLRATPKRCPECGTERRYNRERK